jgi:hypothetical protein
MNTILVWVLITFTGSKAGVVQLGNYATLDDCNRILNSQPLSYNNSIEKQCVQVNMVVVK